MRFSSKTRRIRRTRRKKDLEDISMARHLQTALH
jgi:hypothetical protein